MAELTADLFVTLDGFAAGIDVGPFFGYSGPELGSWVRDALGQRHLVLMGRLPTRRWRTSRRLPPTKSAAG